MRNVESVCTDMKVRMIMDYIMCLERAVCVCVWGGGINRLLRANKYISDEKDNCVL